MTADGAPSGTPPEGVHRPDPARWVWYAFGGSLPSRYDTWVYRDTTSRTWVLRHFARSLVQLAVPIAAVIVLLPGPLWVRLMTALGGVLLGLIFSSAYMTETIEHRLVRAGYPAGTAAEAHQRAAGERETTAALRRRKAAARRAARYQARMRG